MTNNDVRQERKNPRGDGCARDIDRDELVMTTLDLLPVEVGEEVWVPVSMVRGDAFRAVKVEVKERASVGGYEEKHAIEDWEGDIERLHER